MKNNTINKKRKGFTLIELVIVIVILGILAGVAALSFNNMTKSSKNGVAKANLRAIKSAIMMYQATHEGKYPDPEGTNGLEKIKDLLEDSTYTKPDGYTYKYEESTTSGAKYDLYVEGGDLKKAVDEGTLYIFK